MKSPDNLEGQLKGKQNAEQEQGKENLEDELIKIAEKAEELGLGCIVVDNPFRKENGVTHCFIFTQPDARHDSLSEQEFKAKLSQVENVCAKMARESKLPEMTFGLGPVMIIDSLKRWFDFLRERNKHPIISGDPLYGLTDIFLSKVIHGQANHEALVQAFQEKYGPNFIQNCFDAWMKECERRQKKIEEINQEFAAELKERKKPLNRYEVAEIKDFLRYCLEIVEKNKISTVVGIDCSGRPLAIMLVELLKQMGCSALPSIEFLDPHQMRDKLEWRGKDKPIIPKAYQVAFQKEFPELYQKIIQDPNQILFIDDQVFSHAHTFSTIQAFISQLINREDVEINFTVVSGFNGYNALTWWKNKKLLRIKNNKDCESPTLKSVQKELGDGEEKAISEFEKKLLEIVSELAQEIKVGEQ